MENEIALAGSSMQALTQQFRGVAHNLANVNTVGYKRLGTSFANTLQSEMAGGEVKGTTAMDMTQGALTRTGRALDLALEGAGFFVIETPNGELYTRNGTFRVNADGQLVDASGRTVAGQNGPIVLPATESTLKVQVAADGNVSVAGRRIGKLKCVEFDDPSVLVPVGGSCYKPNTPVQPTESTETTFHQGFQEASNVSPVKELVQLITVSRMFQANMKGLEKTDERLRHLLQVAMGS